MWMLSPLSHDSSCFANWRETHTAIQGNVYDEVGEPVGLVLITGKVLGAGKFLNGSDTMTTVTQKGGYQLIGAPIGIAVSVQATKASLTPRIQTIVPVINREDDPDLNLLNFGRQGTISRMAQAD